MAAFAADFEKRGAPYGAGWDRLTAAGCIEGLCSLRSGGDSGFAAEGEGGGFAAVLSLLPPEEGGAVGDG